MATGNILEMSASAAKRLPLGILFIVGINGLFLAINGLFMLAAPKPWYDLVPGVTDTGFFNQHFVRDIGIVQLYLGVAFWAGLFNASARVACGRALRCGLSPTPFSIFGKSLPASVRLVHCCEISQR